MPLYFIIVGIIASLKYTLNKMNTIQKYKAKDDLERMNKASMRMKVNISDLLILKIWLK